MYNTLVKIDKTDQITDVLPHISKNNNIILITLDIYLFLTRLHQNFPKFLRINKSKHYKTNNLIFDNRRKNVKYTRYQ